MLVLVSYQVEALEKAIKDNTIVFLETGSGKTLIAIMLLRSYAHFLRKPSPFFAVFLVPQVVLVRQVCFFLVFTILICNALGCFVTPVVFLFCFMRCLCSKEPFLDIVVDLDFIKMKFFREK